MPVTFATPNLVIPNTSPLKVITSENKMNRTEESRREEYRREQNRREGNRTEQKRTEENRR